MKKRTVIRRMAFIALLSAALVLTVAAQGSENDPLVTLGYLTEKFLPQVVEEVELKAAERDRGLEERVQEMLDEHAEDLEKKIKKLTPASDGQASSAAFAVVTMEAGQRLTLTAGGELLFRSGTAVCVSPSSPGLVDSTTGEVLESGSPLAANHLYLATDNSRGLAASETVTLLVRGAYILE